MAKETESKIPEGSDGDLERGAISEVFEASPPAHNLEDFGLASEKLSEDVAQGILESGFVIDRNDDWKGTKNDKPFVSIVDDRNYFFFIGPEKILVIPVKKYNEKLSKLIKNNPDFIERLHARSGSATYGWADTIKFLVEASDFIEEMKSIGVADETKILDCDEFKARKQEFENEDQ